MPEAKSNKNPEAEMSFFAHIEALRWLLLRSAAVIITIAIVLFFYNDILFGKIILGPMKQDFITYKIICKLGWKFLGTDEACFTVPSEKLYSTELSGQFSMHMWVSIVGGIIIGIPYVLWEIWRFVKPALKDKEIKPFRGIVLIGTVLFLIGAAFSYFLIFPLSWNFLAPYKVDAEVNNIIVMDSYISVLNTLTVAFGLVFEMPMAVYFLSRAGIMSPSFMKKYRKHAVVVILVAAAIITPTSDIPSLMAVFVPLYVLYEASIFVSKYVYKKYKMEV